jgi:mediator of RNA polymerase II transcription subunit 5
MDGRNAARAALRTDLAFWNKFFAGCIAKRVESEQFQRVVEVVQKDYPLPPAAIADIFLRPTPTNHISLDPSVPLYLQTLANLGYIDTPSILKALYKYSSSQDHVRSAQPLSGDANAEQAQKEKETQCWSNSYWVEEYMFYRLIGVIVENRTEQDSRTVLEIVRIVSKWMGLFTAVSTAFGAGALEQLPHVREAVRRDGMESARAAFVALLLRLCESQPLIRTITKPFAKGQPFFFPEPGICTSENIGQIANAYVL